MKRPQQDRNRHDRNQGRSNGRSNGRRPPSIDVWRPGGPLPELVPIQPAHDVTAMIRSLGEPPMNGGIEAGYHFGTVVERAAAVARALAFSADLLADPDD